MYTDMYEMNLATHRISIPECAASCCIQEGMPPSCMGICTHPCALRMNMLYGGKCKACSWLSLLQNILAHAQIATKSFNTLYIGRYITQKTKEMVEVDSAMTSARSWRRTIRQE